MQIFVVPAGGPALLGMSDIKTLGILVWYGAQQNPEDTCGRLMIRVQNIGPILKFKSLSNGHW